MIGIEIEMVKQVSKVTVVLAKRSKLGADAYCQEHLLHDHLKPCYGQLWIKIGTVHTYGQHLKTYRPPDNPINNNGGDKAPMDASRSFRVYKKSSVTGTILADFSLTEDSV